MAVSLCGLGKADIPLPAWILALCSFLIIININTLYLGITMFLYIHNIIQHQHVTRTVSGPSTASNKSLITVLNLQVRFSLRKGQEPLKG